MIEIKNSEKNIIVLDSIDSLFITAKDFSDALNELASSNWKIKQLMIGHKREELNLYTVTIKDYENFPKHLVPKLNELLLPILDKYIRNSKISNIINEDL